MFSHPLHGVWVLGDFLHVTGAWGWFYASPQICFPMLAGKGEAHRVLLGQQQLNSASFLCLQKCVNDYLFHFGWLDCSLNNIFPEEGDLNMLQHLEGRCALPDEHVGCLLLAVGCRVKNIPERRDT